MPELKSKTKAALEKLEHRILHGLACEWEAALWILSSHHRNLMQKPLISLNNMQNRLGYYSREKREICLSRNFVLNHTWDSVRDVFLHEMAHQFVDQALGACNESPHGPKFQEACRILRANPRASGNYRPLREQIMDDRLSPEDKILLRIKKLMALAQSQHHHEAEAAMAKAHELIEKYNIDLLTENEKRNFVSLFLGQPALRHHRENYHLARLILDFYFVQGLWVPSYVLEKGKMGRVLEISGTVQNVKIAGYIHDYVRYYIHSQWLAYNKNKDLNRYRRTDFSVGIIEGFRLKLESQKMRKQKIDSKTALTKIEDPLLKKYLNYKYPRTVNFTRKVYSQDNHILNDGIKIGEKLVISKGITDKRKSTKLLPP